MKQFIKELKKIHSYNIAFLKLIGSRESVEAVLILLIGFSLHSSTISNCLIVSIFILLSFLFFTQTLNDIYDFKIDSANKRDKPLVQGIFSIKFARYVAFYFFVCAVFFGVVAGDIIYLFSALVLLVLGFLYSYPKTSFSKRPVLSLVTILLGYVVIPFYLGNYSATGSFLFLDSSKLLLGLIAITLGRLILKDMRDKKGDQIYGRKNLALILKKDELMLLSFFLFLLGVIFTFFGVIGAIKQLFVFFLISVLYLMFIWVGLFQRLKAIKERQKNKTRTALIKIYLASRLYLLAIVWFLVM